MKTLSLAAIALAATALLSPAAAEAPKSDDSATSATAVALPKPGTTRVVDQAEVRRILADGAAEITVVNFWATFCGPCVEEIPYFARVARESKPEDVRVLGISVDLKAQIDSHVVPFLRQREVPYPNVVFYGDQEELINFFAPEWMGDLPVTFLYDRQGRQVGKYLRPLKHEELVAAIAAARARAK